MGGILIYNGSMALDEIRSHNGSMALDEIRRITKGIQRFGAAAEGAKLSVEEFIKRVETIPDEEPEEIIQEAERQIRISGPAPVFSGPAEAINPSRTVPTGSPSERITSPDKHGIRETIRRSVGISRRSSAELGKIASADLRKATLADISSMAYTPAWHGGEAGVTGTTIPEGVRVVDEAKLTPTWIAHYIEPSLSPYLQFAVGDDLDLDLEDFGDPTSIFQKIAVIKVDPEFNCITCPVSKYPIGLSYIIERWGDLLGNRTAPA